MTRTLLVLLAATAGCVEDFDLGSLRDPPAPGAPDPLPPAVARCAPDDPALLEAPDTCAQATDETVRHILTLGGSHATCVVDGAGSLAVGVGSKEPVPNCPFGVYFSLEDHFAAENVEGAVSVRREDFLPDGRAVGELLTRAVDVFADRAAFFVRVDPRAARGRVVDVAVDMGVLFPGSRFTPGSAGGLQLTMTEDDPVIAAKDPR
jgi:hypothetical protein